MQERSNELPPRLTRQEALLLRKEWGRAPARRAWWQLPRLTWAIFQTAMQLSTLSDIAELALWLLLMVLVGGLAAALVAGGVL